MRHLAWRFMAWDQSVFHPFTDDGALTASCQAAGSHKSTVTQMPSVIWPIVKCSPNRLDAWAWASGPSTIGAPYDAL